MIDREARILARVDAFDVNLPFQNVRRRSTKSQSIEGFDVLTPVMSIPSYILRSSIVGPGCAPL